MKTIRLFFLLLLGLTILPSSPLMAKALISDTSDQLITIDTNFIGTHLLLFGARMEAGDIVVVVRGPKKNYAVYRKKRVAGIWVNKQSYQFKDVDSYYAIASSRPLSAISNDELLQSLGITITDVPFTPDGTDKYKLFKQALLSRKQKERLYVKEIKQVPFIGGTLFKILIHFPENIPPGTYTAETYLFNNGQLSAIQSSPITVEKVGFDAFVANLAHSYPTLYGLIAISIALAVGWMAGVFFRKT